MEKPCVNCGQAVNRPPSHFKKVKNVYCSDECRQEYITKRKQKVCAQCGEVFIPSRPEYIHCSPQCSGLSMRGKPKSPQPQKRKRINLSCSVCGKPIVRRPSELKGKSDPVCSYECNGILRGQEWAKYGHKGRDGWTEESYESARQKMSGKNNPAWKGGITYRKRKGNYTKKVKYIRCPDEFKSMARKDGYVLEHRLIMAQHLGRPLTRKEVVHHINHNPLDNRIENLQLFASNGEHKRHEGETGYFKEYYRRTHTTRRTPD